MRSVLSKLFNPIGADAFLEKHWPNRMASVHGNHLALKPLLGSPQIQSVESILRHWPLKVLATLPDFDDESSALLVEPENALKLYSNRMNLTFTGAQEVFGFLNPWLQGLRSELGLPLGCYSRCILYASPDGKGASPHFDQNANFVIQISGTKLWKLAPNPHVRFPLQRHVQGTPVSAGLFRHCERPLPRKPAAEEVQVKMRPGSVLFVPRGWWHSTSARGDSFSLNFTFSQPSWSELLGKALTWRLNTFEAWRDLADGVESPHRRIRERAMRRFDFLIKGMLEDLGNLEARSIIEDSNQPLFEKLGPAFARIPGCRMLIQANQVFIYPACAALVTIVIDEESRGLFRWISKKTGAIFPDQVQQKWPSLSRNQAVKILATLKEAGALRQL